MKKLFFAIFFPTVLFAQVGIGTSTPTADLHVAGNTSTIRIGSLNSANDPTHNDGIKPSPAYVTALGDVTLNPSTVNGTGPGGIIAPINFLISNQDFIANGPQNEGVIINNDLNTTNVSGLVANIPFSSPSDAIIEVKYSISTLLSKIDLNTVSVPAQFNDLTNRIVKYYFCIDINNDGLSADELSKKLGINSQSYSSFVYGILGYSYTNGTGFAPIPQGNHSIHFFMESIDGSTKYTSIGTGGANDLLRIRIYN